MEDFKNEMHKLAQDKNMAFKLDMDLKKLSELRKLLESTSYADGLTVEIIVAYLLGYFKRLTRNDGWGELFVTMSAFLDKHGIDFVLTRFGLEHKIQLKFNDMRPYDIRDDVYLFRAAPSKKFEGANFMGMIDRGDSVFLNFLSVSETYDDEELYKFFEEHESFAVTCREAWEIVRI